MKSRSLVLAGVLGCFVAGLAAPAPAAEAPSQNYIAKMLKTRGLPTLGAKPADGQDTVRQEASTGPSRVKPRAAVQPSASADHPSIGLRTVTFEFDSAELKPESTETLRNLGNALNQELKDEKSFQIEGHTDASGERLYNDDLSRRRAQTVKDYLVQQMNVAPDRLEIVGKGGTDPADPKNPYSAENRRVVVVNLGG